MARERGLDIRSKNDLESLLADLSPKIRKHKEKLELLAKWPLEVADKISVDNDTEAGVVAFDKVKELNGLVSAVQSNHPATAKSFPGDKLHKQALDLYFHGSFSGRRSQVTIRDARRLLKKLPQDDPTARKFVGVSRGHEVITAEGSIVFVGNIDGDIETIVRTSNLFYPMPEEMDTAFYDRIHAYIPGWEFQKTRDETYTDHFGLVTDYLAEVFREFRKRSFGDYAERYFRFGSHLGGRDQKAVRKTVSGLIKLLHPNGEVTREETQEYLEYSMEMRRRVKEQLKKRAVSSIGTPASLLSTVNQTRKHSSAYQRWEEEISSSKER